METARRLRVNISKYYLFQFFNSIAFFSPVIVLFWQAHGLSMTQITLLESLYSLGVIILELPTGAFADHFGKRTSLIIGALFYTVGFIFYGLSTNFWQFALGELIVGTGAAFISGADRAYLHQLLYTHNKEAEFKKIEGRARGWIQIAQALGNVLGGLIASISLGLTLISTSFSTLLSFFVALSFPTTKKELPREENTRYVQIIKESILLVQKNKTLLWLTLFYAFFSSLLWPLNFFSQPYLSSLGVPVYLFGVIFMCFSLIAGVGSMLTNRFEKLTKHYSFFFMSIVSVVVLFLMGFLKNMYIFPFWSLFLTFVFMNQTIISDQVLKIIPHSKAATVLSFQSLSRRMVFVVVAPMLGVASDVWGLETALVYYSVATACVLGILLILRPSYVGD